MARSGDNHTAYFIYKIMTKILNRKTATGRIERTILHALIGVTSAVATVLTVDNLHTLAIDLGVDVVEFAILVTAAVSILHEVLNDWYDAIKIRRRK